MVPQALQTRRLIILCAFAAIILLYLWLPFQPPSFRTGSSKATKTPSASSRKDSIITNNVAAIIDTRPLDRVVPLLLHFSSVLGPDWPIFLFTSQDIVSLSAPFNRLIDEGRLAVRFLPPTVDFRNRLDVSGFLTEAWLWEQLSPAKHVLIFQSDSILCSNSPLKVDDFLFYDFVDAPIDPAYGEGYNGGLSLRNRSMVLDIIHSSSWRDEFDHAKNKLQQSVEFEDQWFYSKMKALPDRGKAAARLPSQDVAKTFSVETVWYDKPFGYHQVQRWQPDKMDQVHRWCPEYKIAMSEVINSAKAATVYRGV
ncbi:hypothetical protein F5884DRAFT_808558 [Xylogone sp. PMI_703]|nr:hypothetical protein F5884DRAFT_808558 [Xylogone sp. PMI_703]